jgi:hypothetical protein
MIVPITEEGRYIEYTEQITKSRAHDSSLLPCGAK